MTILYKDDQICPFNKFEMGFFQIFPEGNVPQFYLLSFQGGVLQSKLNAHMGGASRKHAWQPVKGSKIAS